MQGLITTLYRKLLQIKEKGLKTHQKMDKGHNQIIHTKFKMIPKHMKRCLL